MVMKKLLLSLLLSHELLASGFMPGRSSGSGSGNVTGPNSSTTHDVCAYADTSGTVLEDTGIQTSALCTLTGSQVLTNKTLTTPIISSISNTGTLTLPTSSDTLVGKATTDTLTNKTLTSPVITTPTGFIEVFTGHIETAANKTYVLDQAAAYAYTINTLKIIDTSGTVTAAIKINGTAVTSISAVSVSNSVATGTASGANTVAIGDLVTLVLTSNSTALDVTYTLKVTR